MADSARLEELQRRFEENPRRFFAPLANEHRKRGALDAAIAICRAQLRRYPEHMSGHVVLGQALYEAGDRVEAARAFEAALALDPENLIALRHLGDIARERGDAGTARRWYARVLDADPRNEEVEAQLAALAAPLPGMVEATAIPAAPTFADLLEDEVRALGAPAAPTASEAAPAPLSGDVHEAAEAPAAGIPELEPIEWTALDLGLPAAPPGAADEPAPDLQTSEEADLAALAVTQELATRAMPVAEPELGGAEELVVDVGGDAGGAVEPLGASADEEDDDEAPWHEPPPASAPVSPPASPTLEALPLEPAVDVPLDDSPFSVAATPGLEEPEDDARAGDAAAPPEGGRAPTVEAPIVVTPDAVTPDAATPDYDPVVGLDLPPEVPPVPLTASAPSPAPAFVTETMARLLLEQGHAARALEVYRQLAVQRPDDADLRARVDALGGAAPDAEPSRTVASVAGPGEPSAADVAAADALAGGFAPLDDARGDDDADRSELWAAIEALEARRTPAEPFVAVAGHVAAPDTRADAPAPPPPPADDVGDVASGATDAAGGATEDAPFGLSDFSFDRFFAGLEDEPVRPRPAPDAFPADLWPDADAAPPAARAQGGASGAHRPADPDARSAPTPPPPPIDDDARARTDAEDLAQFHAWLKGLVDS